MPYRVVKCRLKAERMNRGFTLDYIHRVAGIRLETLKKYEQNLSEPSVSTALLVAETLGVHVEKIWSVEVVETCPPPKEMWDE